MNNVEMLKNFLDSDCENFVTIIESNCGIRLKQIAACELKLKINKIIEGEME